MSLLSRLAVQAARAYGILSSKGGVSASYLVVAGGGAGGIGYAGGGGAGGLLTGTATLSTLNTYTVTIGAGGTATGSNVAGGVGGNSVLSGTGLTTLTSTGGGGGAGFTSGQVATAGGSGGGGMYSSLGGYGNPTGGAGTSGQGFAGGTPSGTGGYFGGGGGGASAIGANGSGSSDPTSTGGNGGAGTASSISGTSVTYAGGGGGGARSGGTAGTGGSGGGGAGSKTSSVGATAGTANTGGGGGGACDAVTTAAAGGSGIVIISYASATPKFVGGTLTTSGGNQIHTFTSSGTLSPITPITASYLVVAGGGGSGSGNSSTGGAGGGAGGLLTSSTTLYSGATYVVTVGAGGAGSPTLTSSASSGGNSVLSGTGLTTVTATGGGYGATYTVNSNNGANGGSGGGSEFSGTAGTGTSGQGYAGGGSTSTSNYGCGGGGGSGGVGATGTTTASGNGGIATASSISGTSTYYAGGGGGGFYSTSGFGLGGGTATVANKGGAGDGSPTGVVGNAGVANTGGGAGGAGGGNTAIGAAGGSGTVIISYAGSQVFNGGLVTSSGGNTIHTFNATGALTPLTNNLNNSLRFRASNSANLQRTPAIATNRRTWTWSAWVKRGTIGSITQGLFLGNYDGNDNSTYFGFSGDQFFFFNRLLTVANGNIYTTQVFRDVSAWYHIVVAMDTTQATAANRFKLYINGNQVTSFAIETYPTQNTDMYINSNVQHNIGFRRDGSTNSYFDGYMTDINFIDGQALEPYYFGNNDAYGNWKPILYKGTYGTNGFYLTFGNTTSTTTLGYDSSPNGNNWTTSGISVTAGATYDAMTDVPTNTSATVANYPTINPLDNGGLTISSANLKASTTSTSYLSTRCSMAIPSSGKYYWEYTVTAQDTGVGSWFSIGMATASVALTGFVGGVAGSIYYGDRNDSSSQILNETTAVYTGSAIAFATGDTLQIAYDADTGKFWFGKNNAWWDSSAGTTGSPSSGTNQTLTAAANTYFPLIQLRIGTSGTNTADINFGQRPFLYTPPTGFVALNTYNLPTPTILQGNLYMDATLWTGNSSTQVVVNQGQFKPDAMWIKTRSAGAYNHHLVDSVRGIANNLRPNVTGAEQATTDQVTAINSNGFTLGKDTAGPADSEVNVNGNTYVGWQWQAGQGSTSSNTSGSITSTVSVNTTAGFSVATYTGTGANATIGHGLGVSPKFLIIKERGNANGWYMYHVSTGNTVYLDFTSAAGVTGTGYWQSTTPSSTVVSISSTNSLNRSGGTYVMYAWAEIAGFSKFGSYTGNGSTDGVFVYLGFRPKYVMIKCSSAAGNDWPIIDTSRATYNAAGPELYADLSQAESTSNYIDIVSNGFKIRSTGGQVNTSATTYIYAAWAENPFKNSNAR